ncbi:TPR-like protein [Coprinopsis marcescibilis]|uniref:TPR-like protein n=1 Tax=Coprinopsis marcescibilis TaxID=230819 RepID=A0A5C3KVT7_COPMA|nr:TPR-like protein [Coprinopsis marcescibilis]
MQKVFAKVNRSWKSLGKPEDSSKQVPKTVVDKAPLHTSPEVFKGASHNDLQDVNMNVASGDINQQINIFHVKGSQSTENEIQDALRRLPDPKQCTWDSSRACFSGTRQTHIDDMWAWINKSADSTGPREPTTQLYLVADAVGSGKSSLAHTISQQAHDRGHLVASFFFDQLNDQSTLANFLAVLIRGLCNVNDEVRAFVGGILAKDTSLALARPHRQFKEIVIPAATVLPFDRQFVLTVDALDEERDVVLLDIMRDLIPLLPLNFRTVATTRSEPRCMQHLQHQKHVYHCPHSLTGVLNHDDIAAFIRQRLSETDYGPGIPSDLVEDFVDKSEGVFLWASTVLNHLRNTFDPIDELRDILHSRSTHWVQDGEAAPKLDHLYSRILSKLKWTDTRFVTKYRTIVGAIATVKDPLSPSGLASLYEPAGITEGDVEKLCTLIRPLLRNYSAEHPHRHLQFIHLSVQEYLSERAPSPYRIHSDEHHQTLSRLSLLSIQHDLVPEKVPTLGYSNVDHKREVVISKRLIPRIPMESVSEHLLYSCLHLEEHTLSIPSENLDMLHLQLIRDVLAAKEQYILEATAALGKVINTVAMHNLTWRLPTGSPDRAMLSEKARLYQSMDRCLQSDSEWEEALSLAREATAIYRQIMSVDPSGDLELEMGWALQSLSQCLLEDWEPMEAMGINEEGVIIARRLAETRPSLITDMFQLLARLLCTQSDIHSRLDRHEEAVECRLEAVDLYRKLSASDPSTFQASLAWALRSLSTDFNRLERRSDAISAAREAVDISRQITIDPGPHLAHSLTNYARHLTVSGSHDQSIEVLGEAVDVYRRVAATDARYHAELVSALRKLTTQLDQAFRYDEAASIALDAIDMLRQISNSDPTTHNNSTLSTLLMNYAHFLSGAGKDTESIKPGEEGLCMARALAEADPRTYESDLAETLGNHSVHLSNCGRYDDAAGFMLEAAVTYRRLLVDGYNCEDNLAQALNCYAWNLAFLGREEEALGFVEESVDICRQLVATNICKPHELANYLHTLAHTLNALKRFDDALPAAKESITIYCGLSPREVALIDPRFLLDKFSESLDAYSKALKGSQQRGEIRDTVQEGIIAYRKLAGSDSGDTNQGLEDAIRLFEKVSVSSTYLGA